MAEVGAATILQVHHGEGDLAHHVDPAHLRVELDAVEDHELAVDARDVVEMQIAVALAHEAALAAGQESVAAGGVLALGPGAKLLDLSTLGRGRRKRGDLCEVPQRKVQDSFGGAERAVRGGRGGGDRAVEGGHSRREAVDVGGAEQAGVEQPARERALRKFAHLHRVFQRRPRSADDRRGDAARDRHDLEVERGGEATVEAQLLLAEESARFERREIEEAEIDRLLDLVREGSRQQDVRNVRLEHLGGSGSAERSGARERGYEPRLVSRAFHDVPPRYSEMSSSRLSEIRSRSFTTRPCTCSRPSR